MSRTTNILAGLLLTVPTFALAQQSSQTPQVPEDAFTTRQLIAWSGLQKPQPAPQPLPPRDTPVPQPDQSQDQQSASPADHDSSPSQSFTGKIVKDGSSYVLKSADKAYHLDQQSGLEKYENQSVKVVGNLDAAGEIIHIVKIELLS